jgi:diguanylate cyclase (GGDEF)-like protein
MKSIEQKSNPEEILKQPLGGTFSGLGNAFKLAFEQSGQVQCIVNLEGRILAANNKALALVGTEHHKHLVGKRIWNAPWWRPEQGILIKELYKHACEGQLMERDLDLGIQGSLPKPYHLRFSPILNVFHDPAAILIEAYPVDLKRGQVSNSQSSDPLTGLADKNYLRTYLTDIIHTSKNDPSHSFALLSIKINSLKSITNLFGQAIGDSFIINLARKFRANTRDGDIVARVEEDAFIIALDHLQVTQNAHDFAQRCLKFLEAECQVGETQLNVSAHIGIAFGDGGTNADKLLQQSAEALEQARITKNHIIVYGLDQLEPS